MRIALFTPVNPVRSALCDHIEGLLPYLAERLDITVVTKGDYCPTHPMFHPGHPHYIPWIDYKTFKRQAEAFDLIIYQLGDEANIHGYMFDALHRWPGMVFLHDLVLHHAIVGLTLARGDIDGYIAELRYCYGNEGERIAQEVIAGRGDMLMFQYPVVKRVLDSSLAIVGFNRYMCAQVQHIQPDTPVRYIPYHFYLPEGFPIDFDGAAFRRKLGLSEKPVLASFGFFIPDKRLSLVLSAYKRLLKRHPDAVYMLVGGWSPYYDLEGELAKVGLAGRVRLTGWQAPVPFVQYMHVPDVAIHLRYPHIGGTLYTPIRLLGLGIPTITSDIEPLAELPSDAVVRITPNNADEEEMLTAAMDYLLTRRDVAAAMAERGRRYIAREHDRTTIVEQYIEYIYQVAAEKDALTARVRTRMESSSESLASQGMMRAVGQALAALRVPSDSIWLRPVAKAIADLTNRSILGQPR
ncbi:MAG: glycosyltransferase [Chloroflexi bacterium]|nr:glycosyltransferase [Chloroflexota bacterium]